VDSISISSLTTKHAVAIDMNLSFTKELLDKINCEALWCSGSTLTFESIGHGIESEHRLFSHHSASAFSKLRSLAKCSLDDSVRRLL